GLAGATWEIDDRFTGYDAASIARYGLDGGKMLLRLVDDDPATAPTLESAAAAVSELADEGLLAMVEPLPYRRVDGKLELLKDSASLARAVAIASGVGTTAACTLLKLPAAIHPGPPEADDVPEVVLG